MTSTTHTLEQAQAMARTRTRSEVLRELGLYAVLILLSLAFALPFLWMFSSALKDDPQTYAIPPIWIPRPARWANFPEAMTYLPFHTYLFNTLKIVVPSALGAVFSCTIVAYGFARLRWSWRDPLFFLCLATMMIPFQVRMIPLFIIYKRLNWINSFKPLVVPNWFGGAYFIFMMRQFFMTIPMELSEAATIDGCNEIQTMTRIILPLAKPIIAVVALFSVMWGWNDYLGPLIYINRPEQYPIALGLQHLRNAGTGVLEMDLIWPYLMAASTVTILPIVLLYFFTQRTFIEGIALTGVKG